MSGFIMVEYFPLGKRVPISYLYTDDIAFSYFSRSSKVTEHDTSRVSEGELKAKQKMPKET